MFVSSYNTYLSSSNTQNIKRDNSNRDETKEQNSRLFSIEPKAQKSFSTELPLNYISKYKTLANQQKLQKESDEKLQKSSNYKKITTLENANKAYKQNSLNFSLSYRPKTALTQNTELSFKGVSKFQALNTYIENENYYRATA